MYLLPNAKINIGLNIINNRDDGYHDLQTVFYPIPLTDALEIQPQKSNQDIEFYCSGIKIPDSKNNNLVMKIFRSLQKEFQLPPIIINLSKHIPIGAGLGGGSSDAAFMMKMLNEYFSLDLSNYEMEKRLSEIGADCAFFIRNKATYAEGVGNVFSDIDINLSKYFLALVKPNIHISTKQAYANVVSKRPLIDLNTAIERTPIENWSENIKNDFESSLFHAFPQLSIIKQTLYDIGAVYASMTGSGSALYGIFNRPIDNLSKIFPDCFTFFHELS